MKQAIPSFDFKSDICFLLRKQLHIIFVENYIKLIKHRHRNWIVTVRNHSLSVQHWILHRKWIFLSLLFHCNFHFLVTFWLPIHSIDQKHQVIKIEFSFKFQCVIYPNNSFFFYKSQELPSHLRQEINPNDDNNRVSWFDWKAKK